MTKVIGASRLIQTQQTADWCFSVSTVADYNSVIFWPYNRTRFKIDASSSLTLKFLLLYRTLSCDTFTAERQKFVDMLLTY